MAIGSLGQRIAPATEQVAYGLVGETGTGGSGGQIVVGGGTGIVPLTPSGGGGGGGGNGGGNSGGLSRPDLSSVANEIRAILDNPNNHPTNFQCVACANSIGTIIEAAGFEVVIIHLQNTAATMHGALGMVVEAPGGGTWQIGDSGFHEALVITYQGVDYFFDAVAYQHHGVIALTREEYAVLWRELAQTTLYFYKRDVGDPINPNYNGTMLGEAVANRPIYLLSSGRLISERDRGIIFR